MTTESGVTAPTEPSTDASTRGSSAAPGGGSLARDRLTNGPVIGRLAALDGRHRRAVERAGIEPLARALTVGHADRDGQGIRRIVRCRDLRQAEHRSDPP